MKFEGAAKFSAKATHGKSKMQPLIIFFLALQLFPIPRKDPSAMVPKFIHDSVSKYSVPQSEWHSPQKTNSTKKSFSQYFKDLNRKENDSKNKSVYICFSRNFVVLKFYEPKLCNSKNKNSAIL